MASTAGVYHLRVLEAGSLKLRCGQGWFLLRLEERTVPGSLLGLQMAIFSLHHSTSSSLGVCPSVPMSPFYWDTGHTGLAPPPSDLHQDLISQPAPILRFWGLRRTLIWGNRVQLSATHLLPLGQKQDRKTLEEKGILKVRKVTLGRSAALGWGRGRHTQHSARCWAQCLEVLEPPSFCCVVWSRHFCPLCLTLKGRASWTPPPPAKSDHRILRSIHQLYLPKPSVAPQTRCHMELLPNLPGNAAFALGWPGNYFPAGTRGGVLSP